MESLEYLMENRVRSLYYLIWAVQWGLAMKVDSNVTIFLLLLYFCYIIFVTPILESIWLDAQFGIAKRARKEGNSLQTYWFHFWFWENIDQETLQIPSLVPYNKKGSKTCHPRTEEEGKNSFFINTFIIVEPTVQ